MEILCSYFIYECYIKENTDNLFFQHTREIVFDVSASETEFHHNQGGSRAAETSKIERFVIIVITKRFILDVAAVLR